MAAANVDHADRAGRHRGHDRPRRSGVKVDPGRHRGQATRYLLISIFGHKRRKRSFIDFSSDNHYFFFFFEREREVLVLVWPASLLESGGRYLALGFPRLCGVGPVEPDK